MSDEKGQPYSYKAQQVNKSARIFLPIIFAMVLIIGVMLGFIISKNSANKTSIFSPANPDKLQDVLNIVNNQYVDTVNTNELLEAAIEDVLADLDPHSVYLPPVDYETAAEDLQGSFEGVGIEFFIVKDTIMIVTPIAGGPSDALGIQAGDKIITIEDSTIAGVGVKNEHVVAMLRGEKGTKVTIEVKRAGSDGLIEYEIKRAKIPMYSVDVRYMIDDEIGYLKVNRFSATTYDEYMDGLKALKKEGMTKLILDLRQNPGGYLDASIRMLDELIAGKSLLLYTEGKAYKREDYRATKPGVFEEGELVILIDDGSASASEIMSGAVQDWDRGLVIGRRSFGKGLVQQEYILEDNSALRLTIARYYTPSGRCIQKPYNDGVEAYHKEVYDRYENGEFLSVDSMELSDSTEYITANGRKVFGGGGVMPDIFVPIDTSVNWAYYGEYRKHIQDFVYDHFSNNAEKYKAYKLEKFVKTFKVDANLYNDFVTYAHGKGVKQDEAETSLLKARINNQIKARLAKQVWSYDGYYRVVNQFDTEVTTAIEYLNSPKYKELLSPAK